MVDIQGDAGFEKRHLISITELCNNNCIFCIDKKIPGKNHKDVNEIITELKEAHGSGCTKAIISGGEPTIHPDFLEIIKKTSEIGFRKIQAITNGRMFSYLPFMKKAVNAGLTEITFSISGHTEELQNRITQSKESFNQAVQAIRNSGKFPNLKVNADIVVLGINYDLLPEIFLFLYDLGIREFGILNLMLNGNAYENKELLDYSFDDATPYIKKVLDIGKEKDAVIWVNRYPPEYLEGYEEYIGDPRKMVDGVKAVWGKIFENNDEPGCRGIRCEKCSIRLICSDLIETRKQLADSYKEFSKTFPKNLDITQSMIKPKFLSKEDRENNDCLQFSKIKQKLGVDLTSVDLEKDDAHINKTLKIIDNLPSKDLKLLILVGSIRKGRLMTILSFFDRVKVGGVDLYVSSKGGFNMPLKNIRQVSKEDIISKDYDYVISFCGMSILDNSLIKGNLNIIPRNDDLMYLKLKDFDLKWLMSYEDDSVYCYSMNRDKLSRDLFGKFAAKMNMKLSVNGAPDNYTDFKVPKNHLFDYIVFGGKDRDYKFLYENRNLFKGKKVVVTKSNTVLNSEQRRYMELLDRLDNFVCIDRINPNLFMKIFLYSRVCIAFFEGMHNQDYTSISESMWYGKPTITNKVKANNHLGDFLFFVNNSEEFADCMKKLEDEIFYASVSKKISEFSRENSLFQVLVGMYHDFNNKKRQTNPREIYEGKIIATKEIINSEKAFLQKGKEYILELLEPEEKLHFYSKLTPKLEEVKLFIERVSDFSKLSFRGVPLCIIPKSLRENIRQLNIQKPLLQVNGKMDYIGAAEILSRNAKIKPLKCKSCSLYDACPGIYLQYFRAFGSGELQPK